MGALAMFNGNDRMKQQIESIRAHMMNLGLIYGLNDPKVLHVSRELDDLIVCYYRTQSVK
jgi:hypothetical protein